MLALLISHSCRGLTPSLGVGVGGRVRLPRPRDVLDDAVYLAGVYPGVPIQGAKADVSGAFKLLWLAVHLLVLARKELI